MYGKQSVSKLSNSYPGINKVSQDKKVYTGIRKFLSQDNSLPRVKIYRRIKLYPMVNYPEMKVIPV